MDIPKIVVNNRKKTTSKAIDELAIKAELLGQRTALIDLQTDIWEKIEAINKKLLVLMPPKKKRKDSNVY
tara:strand:- start:343 stop:552 length:210 start_codon:yes stop_codon:yes gene_type:complete